MKTNFFESERLICINCNFFVVFLCKTCTLSFKTCIIAVLALYMSLCNTECNICPIAELTSLLLLPVALLICLEENIQPSTYLLASKHWYVCQKYFACDVFILQLCKSFLLAPVIQYGNYYQVNMSFIFFCQQQGY